MFISAAKNSESEVELRKERGFGKLVYGIPFLDDALKGILFSDLILIGAPSGLGKTNLCCNIALANLENGKRIHYVALEAEPGEIEARLKFQIISDMYFKDSNRPDLGEKFVFDNWYIGKYLDKLKKYEDLTTDFFRKAFFNLFLYYKPEIYGINEFIESVLSAADSTDLIIVDHVHYFDIEDENENRAIKQIAKTARSLALENQKPIILVSHLRKKNLQDKDMVPGMDEFHGSSDLYKIATRVITFAPGGRTKDGCYETFFRIPKNRINGGVTHFIGRTIFDPRKGSYEKEYKLGHSFQQRGEIFEEIDSDLCPEWSKPRIGSNLYPGLERPSDN